MGTFVLLSAQPSPWQVLAVRVVFFLVGLVMLGVGYYAIKTKQLLMSRRQKSLLKVFGVDQVSPRWATIGGVVQLVIGLTFVALPIAGPYFGILSMHEVARQPRMPKSRIYRPPPSPFEEENDDYEPPAPLAKAETTLPAVMVKEDYLSSTAPFGHEHPGLDATVDKNDQGGILVGVQLTKGDRRRDEFESLQFIYQVGGDYVLGDLTGQEGPRTVRLLAKPGFVVGGAALDLFAGRIRSLKLIYYKMQDAQVGPNAERYESEVLGDDMFGRNDQIDIGQPFLGVEILKRRDRIEVVKFQYVDQGLAQLGEAEPASLPTIAQSDDVHFHEIKFWKRVAGGSELEERAPQDGVLVGFRTAFSSDRRGSLQGLQAIYQVGNRYTLGKSPATAGMGAGRQQTILARPGYVVGGWTFFGRAEGMRINFMRLLDTGMLDTTDSYESDLLGRGDGDQQTWNSEGAPVVAFRYRAMGNGVAMPALGAARFRDTSVADATPEAVPDSSSIVRDWTNQAGKTIRAKLVKYNLDQGAVTLQRKGSAPVTIPISKLSSDDQTFLRNLPR